MPNAQRVIDQLSEMQGDPVDIGAEDLSHKGVANGYAALDADGYVAVEQLNVSYDIWDSTL